MMHIGQPVPEQMEKLPVNRVCPTCNNQVLTVVTPALKLTGWVLILFLGFCGLIACCQDGWKEFKHKCPHCSFSFGSYEPPLTMQEKLSLAAVICCLVFVFIIIISIISIMRIIF
jgi:rubredoxin